MSGSSITFIRKVLRYSITLPDDPAAGIIAISWTFGKRKIDAHEPVGGLDKPDLGVSYTTGKNIARLSDRKWRRSA